MENSIKSAQFHLRRIVSNSTIVLSGMTAPLASIFSPCVLSSIMKAVRNTGVGKEAKREQISIADVTVLFIEAMIAEIGLTE